VEYRKARNRLWERLNVATTLRRRAENKFQRRDKPFFWCRHSERSEESGEQKKYEKKESTKIEHAINSRTLT
jgi:hypothetical protein